MLQSLPKHSGFYFIKDNINNLQFKIHFRSLNTLLTLPKYNVPEHTNNKLFMSEIANKNSVPDDDKTVLIKWQQKRFSATECKLYSDLKNCTNDQQKKYHEMLKEKDRDKKQTKKKRQRKHSKAEGEEANTQGNFIFTYVHEDNFMPTNELDKNMSGKLKQHVHEPFEQMFVYADLKPDTQLVVLRWFNRDKFLYIYPDFTDSQNKPYFLEINSDYRHLYSYDIEDVSSKALSLPIKQEQFLYLPELSTHWRIEDELGNKFSMPPKRTQRCAILFSINDVSGFEYHNVHVRYHVHLPENTILEEGLIDATSHTAANCAVHSSTKIGLTWQITLLCEEQFDPSQHLCIFFEVISIDSWERERIEGFAHYYLNLLEPCHGTIKLKCIRPLESLLESISRYFIGGRRKFNYERFVCGLSEDKEAEGKNNFHCRYGGHMQNSGQLSLSCQMLTQRNCKLLNPCLSRTSGMTLDDIMMAYNEARRRLEAVALN